MAEPESGGVTRAFSWNKFVPNLGFFDDQTTHNHEDLEHNNRPVERLSRLLSENTSQRSIEDVPVFDKSNLEVNKRKELGNGAKAIVHPGEIKLDGRTQEVAVKVPSRPSSLSDDSETVRHVRQQMYELRQQYFVEYYGIYRDLVTRKTCVVMQLLKGNSLAHHLAHSYKRMGMRTKISVLLQTALALRHAHARGILVTDLKPDNIMFVEVPDLETNTNTHLRVIDVTENDFTANYSCKEALELNFSKNTDIYTFGVLVWQMFTGQAPYSECANVFQCADKIGKDQRLQIPDEAPIVIKDLIESCWRKPCETTMAGIVEILSDINLNVESIEYTNSCPIPTDLF